MFPQTESINNEAKDYWIATKPINTKQDETI